MVSDFVYFDERPAKVITKSMTLYLLASQAYKKGAIDRWEKKSRDLNAYPYDSVKQCAYEYGWSDMVDDTCVLPLNFFTSRMDDEI